MGVPGSANFLLAGAQGYQIERSLRFNSADSATLSKTPASATNRRSWTWSGWVKRSALGTQGLFSAKQVKDDITLFGFAVNDRLWFLDRPSGVDNAQLITTNVFRDCSAWYHIVITIDTPNATASDRIRFYVNGVRTTQHDVATYPSQNYEIAYINNTQDHRIGTYQDNASNYFNGYLTEVHFIDGQALTPSSFGETDTITGIWKPKRYTGTYGTNGFYLKFADNSGTTSTTLGKDSSGNSNNWTPNNFSVTAGAGNDSLIDTPTPYADGGNGRGNYAVLNAGDLNALNNNGAITLSNGNLEGTCTNAANRALSTLGVLTGKWYAEIVITSITSGVGQAGVLVGYLGGTGNGAGGGPGMVQYQASGNKRVDSGSAAAYGSSYTTNDVIGIALDMDTSQVTFYKNNVSQGAITLGTTGQPYGIGFNWNLTTGQTVVIAANFGQRSFSYTPPSGFLALNTQNLPEPSIKKPSSYFDTKLWTGNGTSQTISGLGFSPDLVWAKRRSTTASHGLVDSVRGTGKTLFSNLTDQEDTGDSNLTAFNSDGFTAGSGGNFNANGETYVAWCWDESATPGFDIVTYTGNATNRTIAHSLGVAPSMVVLKKRSGTTGSGSSDWMVWHSSIGAAEVLYLNATAAVSTNATVFNSTAPTSSVFSLGTNTLSNENTGTYVAYLFSEVAGFSKFGSYTGNGSSDGSFVFCGFRPKVVWFKRTDSTGSWFIEDSARGTYNAMGPELYANSADAETTVTRLDFLSNGFKMRAANAGDNASGGTYIFCAWAESPFKYSLAR